MAGRWVSSIALVAAVALVGCEGPQGPAGPAGADGKQGPAGSAGTASPSISGVIPDSLFLDREDTVVISGSGTDWKDGVQVQLGEGITLDETMVASSTAIILKLKVAANAATGARDVKVIQGTSTLTYKMGLAVVSPMSLSFQGSQAQGSIMFVKAQSLDFLSQFDTTQTGGSLFEPGEYSNIAMSEIPGVSFQINAVVPYAVDAIAFVDVDAAAGEKNFEIISGPAGSQIHFPYPKAINIQARTATALVSGTAATGSVSESFQSFLYKFTPSAATPALLDISVKASGSEDAAPAFALLPKSGKFEDMIDYSDAQTVVTSSTDPYYVMFMDTTGAKDYSFTVTATHTAVVMVAEAASNDTKDVAQDLATLPVIVNEATISDGSDADWFKITVGDADVGKSIHVKTFGGDPRTDSIVDVYAACTNEPDCDNGLLSLGGPSEDRGYHEDFISDPTTAAGVHYVKIEASPDYRAGYEDYNALIRLE